MQPVVTILQATVDRNRADEFRRAFPANQERGLPPYLLATLLLHEDGSEVWRIVTVWRSREHLEEYRRSVDTPAGVLAFRAVGVEPELSISTAEVWQQQVV